MTRKVLLVLSLVVLTLFGAAYLTYRLLQRQLSNKIISAITEEIRKEGGQFSAGKVNVYPVGVYSENVVFIPPKSESPFPLEIKRLDLGISILSSNRSRLVAVLDAEAYAGKVAAKLVFKRGGKSVLLTGTIRDLDFASHPISKMFGVEAFLVNVTSDDVEISDKGIVAGSLEMRVDDFRKSTPSPVSAGIELPPIRRSKAKVTLKGSDGNFELTNLAIDSDLGKLEASPIVFERRPSGKGFLISGTLEVHLTESGLQGLAPYLASRFPDSPPTQHFNIELAGTDRRPELRLSATSPLSHPLHYR